MATVACEGTDVAFATAVLQSPVELLPDTPPGRGLRAFVETDAGAELGLPRDGWRLATLKALHATFVAPTDDGWAFATLVEQPDTSWTFDEGGSCEVVAKAPPALAFAPWTLDTAAPPTPEATSVQVLAREEACANGEPPAERALPPVIEESAASITVTLLVRRLENADCQGNPAYPVVIVLAGPLGERRLLDGSSYPPAARE